MRALGNAGKTQAGDRTGASACRVAQRTGRAIQPPQREKQVRIVPQQAERQTGVRRLTWALAPVLCTLAGMLACAAPALALNPERHYEMVSPPFKDGYGALNIEAVAQDGESVAFFSPGVFAGAPIGLTQSDDEMAYVAHRVGSGWSTESLWPPASLTSEVVDGNQDVSPTLTVTAALGRLGPSNEVANVFGEQAQLFVHSVVEPDISTAWEAAEPTLETPQKSQISAPGYKGASIDFCHVVVVPPDPGEYYLSVPTFSTVAEHLYEVNRGCGGELRQVRLVGLNNSGGLVSPECRDTLGLESAADGDFGDEANGESPSSFNAISAGGRQVFFTATTHCERQENHAQLFVRVGGVRTLEVSRPLTSACSEVPCGGAAIASARPPAEFVGASRDGSRVFFMTKAPLVEGDKDTTKDLYLANIGCPSGVGEACALGEAQNTSVTSLVQVSHDPRVGEAADVQGVVRLAPDGSRVYFVARGCFYGGGFTTEGSGLLKDSEREPESINAI
jgi:hypothetical protein